MRLFLQDSSQGEVPIVNPCDEETTVWKVWSVGREMRADWFVIQRWRTESKEFAKTILCAEISDGLSHAISISTYPVAHSHLKDWPVLLRPSLGYLRMVCPEFEQASKQRKTWYFW